MAIQRLSFPKEMHSLMLGKEISKSSKIISLSPFLAKDGLLRVGGSLRNSSLSYHERHQIIPPRGNYVTFLLFRYSHLKHLHIGPLGLLNIMRLRYCPIAGRQTAKLITRGCITCFKASPRAQVPLMGQLPSCRVNPSPTFYHSGTDYAGPFQLRASHMRGAKSYKSWVVLFVCMSTKACHIELVTSLTTDGFLSALKRFIARRGKPKHVYSDNGTNYVGAARELEELYKFVNGAKDSLSSAAEIEGITWHFIPAHSPHFGGIWKAGVKSVKYHLKRITNNMTFTYEEFYTLLTHIEAVLNSRPLSPLSSDPNDLRPLTPAHFMIGRELLHIPEHDLTHISLSRLNRYQHMQLLAQQFWSRWRKEYLNTQQLRMKWMAPITANRIHQGKIVLLVDDNQPSNRWRLARILEAHPGSDGHISAVTLRTSQGVISRAVTKICPLSEERLGSTYKEKVTSTEN